MTPKEKAKELFDKYFDITNSFYDAKYCTLIAVDEILTNAKYIIPILLESSDLVCSKEYWQAVRDEIEKL